MQARSPLVSCDSVSLRTWWQHTLSSKATTACLKVAQGPKYSSGLIAFNKLYGREYMCWLDSTADVVNAFRLKLCTASTLVELTEASFFHAKNVHSVGSMHENMGITARCIGCKSVKLLNRFQFNQLQLKTKLHGWSDVHVTALRLPRFDNAATRRRCGGHAVLSSKLTPASQ